jgi:lipopolysaccharide/colanic/teichoic acid biosynthesis glycosyltransferase
MAARKVKDGLREALGYGLVLLTLPFWGALALAVASATLAGLGPPILFRQKRVGKGAATFELLKFRTMTDVYLENGCLAPDEDRLPVFGMLLRKTSLDELPQLINVLRGEMNLVGPRPLLPEYLPRYTAAQARRHEVRPGITGWAQVNGRNSLTWEQKFDLDLWYVDHRSLWLDLKILALTVLRVVRRDGISQNGHATMPEFMGTPSDR